MSHICTRWFKTGDCNNPKCDTDVKHILSWKNAWNKGKGSFVEVVRGGGGGGEDPAPATATATAAAVGDVTGGDSSGGRDSSGGGRSQGGNDIGGNGTYIPNAQAQQSTTTFQNTHDEVKPYFKVMLVMLNAVKLPRPDESDEGGESKEEPRIQRALMSVKAGCYSLALSLDLISAFRKGPEDSSVEFLLKALGVEQVQDVMPDISTKTDNDEGRSMLPGSATMLFCQIRSLGEVLLGEAMARDPSIELTQLVDDKNLYPRRLEQLRSILCNAPNTGTTVNTLGGAWKFIKELANLSVLGAHHDLADHSGDQLRYIGDVVGKLSNVLQIGVIAGLLKIDEDKLNTRMPNLDGDIGHELNPHVAALKKRFTNSKLAATSSSIVGVPETCVPMTFPLGGRPDTNEEPEDRSKRLMTAVNELDMRVRGLVESLPDPSIWPLKRVRYLLQVLRSRVLLLRLQAIMHDHDGFYSAQETCPAFAGTDGSVFAKESIEAGHEFWVGSSTSTLLVLSSLLHAVLGEKAESLANGREICPSMKVFPTKKKPSSPKKMVPSRVFPNKKKPSSEKKMVPSPEQRMYGHARRMLFSTKYLDLFFEATHLREQTPAASLTAVREYLSQVKAGDQGSITEAAICSSIVTLFPGCSGDSPSQADSRLSLLLRTHDASGDEDAQARRKWLLQVMFHRMASGQFPKCYRHVPEGMYRRLGQMYNTHSAGTTPAAPAHLLHTLDVEVQLLFNCMCTQHDIGGVEGRSVDVCAQFVTAIHRVMYLLGLAADIGGGGGGGGGGYETALSDFDSKLPLATEDEATAYANEYQQRSQKLREHEQKTPVIANATLVERKEVRSGDILGIFEMDKGGDRVHAYDNHVDCIKWIKEGARVYVRLNKNHRSRVFSCKEIIGSE